VSLKQKAKKAVYTLGYEFWVLIVAIAIVLGGGAILVSYQVRQGILNIGQGAMQTYLGVPNFSPDVIFTVYGVLISGFAAIVGRVMHYVRRVNVAPTVQSMSVENLNKVANRVEEATGKFEKGVGESFRAMTTSFDNLLERNDKGFSMIDAKLSAIHNDVKGKGIKDKILEKIPGAKGEETA